MRVEIPLESNYSSTRTLSDVQQTLNMYPHALRGYRDSPGLVEYASFQSSGAIVKSSSGSFVKSASGSQVTVAVEPGGDDRGMIAFNDALYEVSGPSLYAVSQTGSTYIGGIAGTDPVVMAHNGEQLIIAAGANKYAYTISGGLVAITDVDLGDAYTVTYLDSRFIYDQADGIAKASDLNDGTSIDGLAFAEAEAQPDGLLRVFAQNQLLYKFGSRSIEIWISSGVGKYPFSRQFVIEHGIAGRYAIDSIDDVIFFIDHHKRPAALSPQGYTPLLQESAIGKEWDSYGDAAFENARVQCYSLEQSNFTDFIFPNVSKVWTYYHPKKAWIERSFNSTTIIKAFNETLAAHPTDKKLYKFDFDVSQLRGSPMVRRKDLPLITGELFGAPGAEMIVDCLRIHVQADGEADVTLSLSKDLTNFMPIETKTVSGSATLEFYSLGMFREAIPRIETSSNTKFHLLDASIDAETLDG